MHADRFCFLKRYSPVFCSRSESNYFCMKKPTKSLLSSLQKGGISISLFLWFVGFLLLCLCDQSGHFIRFHHPAAPHGFVDIYQ